MKPLLILILACVVSTVACKKVNKNNTEFTGNWSPDVETYNDPSLYISENSQAVYTFNFEGQKEYKGIARVCKNRLYIGDINYFEIIEYPYSIDTTIDRHYIWNNTIGRMMLANWKMVLYGLKPTSRHISFETTYYKIDY